MAKKKKWKGYAKRVSGYGGEVYALFCNGKRTGTSTMIGNAKKHEDELRSNGYRVRKGLVKE